MPAADAYPNRSAPLIDMYLQANGIILGKAALDELQDGGNSVNPTNFYADGLITTMLNAYNQTRIAGGTITYWPVMHILQASCIHRQYQ